MIGRLHGTLIEKQPPLLMIDVNGVGYEILAPMHTFYHLPEVNLPVTLHTHLIVREDLQQLYGFFDTTERTLFRSLIKVNGIGPKLALSILSAIEPQAFVQCIQHNDTSRLVSIPGVGKKTAERLVIDLRDALKDWMTTDPKTSTPLTTTQSIEDAISALTALGYKPQEAKRIVNKVATPDLNSEALIRLALQYQVKG